MAARRPLRSDPRPGVGERNQGFSWHLTEGVGVGPSSGELESEPFKFARDLRDGSITTVDSPAIVCLRRLDVAYRVIHS